MSENKGETVRELLRSTDHMRRWLYSHGEDAVVGRGEDEKHCPVAEFLRERSGAKMVWVRGGSVKLGPHRNIVFTSRWVSEFAHKVDRVCGDSHVYSLAAQSILDEVAKT